MSLIFFQNDLNSVSLLKLLIFLIVASIYGYLTFIQRLHLSYSKFNKHGAISSKIGMVFVYSVPMLFYIYCYAISTFTSSLYHQLVLWAIVIHFTKRLLEVLFLHTYSGKMSLSTIIAIITGYCATVGTFHYEVNIRTHSYFLEENSILISSILGIILFFAGEIVNLYHHFLLRKLRTSDSLSYQIPQGGLFKYINCPHYLAEIVSWIGIAILSKYIISFGVISIISAYLIARSFNTTKWYKNHFPNYPLERKSIIPYLL